ncbi:MAG TPA: FAD-dependent oxidoreductase, partial [Acetobacteraceae bacterium]|nr:FAD-dependent oxidoreductase [Acetobacteraceae bacterium]
MATAGFAPAVVSARGAATVVVVGGGFAGVACARALRKLDADLQVMLVTGGKSFSACPFGNSVIAGLRKPAQQQHLRAAGPGMRHLLGRRLAVARARVPLHADAGRDHQPVVLQLVAAGERDRPRRRIGRRGHLGHHLHARRSDGVVGEFLLRRLTQARDHRVAEGARAEALTAGDEHDLQIGIELP